MTTDALAALLHECPNLYEVGEETVPAACEGDYRLSATWLRSKGVVVLPPDHPLRTGEPSEAMCEEYEFAEDFDRQAVLGHGSRRNYTKIGLRAALAVLREGT